MFRKIENVFENLFFKKRWVFVLCEDEYSIKEVNDDRYIVKKYSHYENLDTKNLIDDLNSLIKEYNRHKRMRFRELTKTEIQKRLKKNNCGVHIVEDAENKTIVGFYWYLINKNYDKIWHDKFPLPRGCALVFNAYVHPKHRQKGIYNLLQKSTSNHLLKDERIKKVYVIVEDSNIASLDANKKFEYKIDAENYLVKFFGLNLASIIKQGDSSNIYHTIGREF